MPETTRHASLLAVVVAAIVASTLSVIAQAGGKATGASASTEPTAPSDAGKTVANVAAPCELPEATVNRVYKSSGPSGDESVKSAAEFQLGDFIAIEGDDLGKWILAAKQCKPARTIVLFLDGRAIAEDTPTVLEPKQNRLTFQLKRSEASRDIWVAILGQPGWEPRPTKVTIGIQDGYPLESSLTIRLRIIPIRWFGFWAFLFLALLISFFVLAHKSDLLRDSVTLPAGLGKKPFSLARSQMAWWFFIVVASYLLIGLITGDFATSVTQQVLVLVGISAGTMVGSAAVDSQKGDSVAAQTSAAAAQTLAASISQLDGEIIQLKKQIGDLKTQPPPTGPGPGAPSTDAPAGASQLGTLSDQLKDKTTDRAAKQSQFRKLQNVSESFLIDILSDFSGVSFHRFQIAAWTVVLGIVFVIDVYKSLAMPTFDSTLLSLLGISAGTYLGMKIPEATGPKA